MKLRPGRIIWNFLFAVVISILISFVAVPNAADLAMRGFHVTFSLSDCLVAVRTHSVFLYLLPLPYLLACFYTNRELFYDQFVIRFRDMRRVWNIQVKRILLFSCLFSFVFNAAGIAVGLHYTNVVNNWDEVESLYYIVNEKTNDIHFIYIVIGSFLLVVLFLVIYSLLFLLLVWRLPLPILGLLICASCVAADAVFISNGIFIMPIGFLSYYYMSWNTGMIFRIIAAIALIAVLCWLGSKAVRKKEFL